MSVNPWRAVVKQHATAVAVGVCGPCCLCTSTCDHDQDHDTAKQALPTPGMHALLLLDSHRHKEVNKRNSLCLSLSIPLSLLTIDKLPVRPEAPTAAEPPPGARDGSNVGFTTKALAPASKSAHATTQVRDFASFMVEAGRGYCSSCVVVSSERQTRARGRTENGTDKGVVEIRPGSFSSVAASRGKRHRFLQGGETGTGRPVAGRPVAVWRSIRGLSSET